MRLLVTGAAGMLGRDVVAAAESAGHDVTGLARRDLDIADPDAVRAAVAAARPDAVVNCAGWTDVDGAEEHEAEATRTNGAGAGHVAAAAPYVVHVSSDYVFDGRASAPYAEDEPTGPRSAYGRSKLAGEQAVLAAGDHAVARSAWLFGVHGKNFVATMLGLAEERDEVRVVDDQIGCPTFTGHLAGALVGVAEQRLTGVLHLAGAGSCSWYELARAAFEEAGVDCRVVPVSTAEFPRPAERPAWSVLGSTRPDAPALPPWREGLSAYLRSEVLQ
jgi:dTDP-4-dehydrorhamnose reductase